MHVNQSLGEKDFVPNEAKSSWHPGMLHNLTLTEHSMLSAS